MWGEITEENTATSDSDPRENLLSYVITRSDAFFRSQQKDEPDLSQDEKRKIASELLMKGPKEFLSRFWRQLDMEHAAYFEAFKSDYEVQYYLQEIYKNNCKFITTKVRKNRRFQAMQKMITENDTYFSEEEMKKRNPLLYEQLVEKYMSENEKEQAAASQVDRSNCALSSMILEHMDINKVQDTKKQQTENEEIVEEDESSDDDSDQDVKNDETVDGHQKQLLKQEFLNAMHQQFLNGEDPHFNYREVDEDSSLDDLKALERDEEESYFDAEEEEDIPDNGTGVYDF